MDIDERQSKIQKKEDNLDDLFIHKPTFQSLVTAIERGDREECHIGFPSLTFQNS